MPGNVILNERKRAAGTIYVFSCCSASDLPPL